MIFKVNGKDFSPMISGFKVGYEVLVSENSGRNANGDTVLDVINRKRKAYVTLRHTTESEMASFLSAVEPFIVTVDYYDSRSRSTRSFQAYTGTAEPEWYNKALGIYKPMNLNFIEL